ncbi:hypothetical protein G6F35_014284 [Rhizopus arrhizus]|nr:hypothetical protein G6F35_014284 [Rhizopus arrhizus]
MGPPARDSAGAGRSCRGRCPDRFSGQLASGLSAAGRILRLFRKIQFRRYRPGRAAPLSGYGAAVHAASAGQRVARRFQYRAPAGVDDGGQSAAGLHAGGEPVHAARRPHPRDACGRLVPGGGRRAARLWLRGLFDRPSAPGAPERAGRRGGGLPAVLFAASWRVAGGRRPLLDDAARCGHGATQPGLRDRDLDRRHRFRPLRAADRNAQPGPDLH